MKGLNEKQWTLLSRWVADHRDRLAGTTIEQVMLELSVPLNRPKGVPKVSEETYIEAAKQAFAYGWCRPYELVHRERQW